MSNTLNEFSGMIQYYLPRGVAGYIPIQLNYNNETEFRKYLSDCYDTIIRNHIQNSVYKIGKLQNKYEIDVYTYKEFNFFTEPPKIDRKVTYKNYSPDHPFIKRYNESVIRFKNVEINRIVNCIKNNQNNSIQLKDDFKLRELVQTTMGTQTIFEENEVLKLCRRISSPFVRNVLSKRPYDFELLHKIAMKCYNKYGGAIISFLMSLPELNFGNYNANKFSLDPADFDGSLYTFNIKIGDNGALYNFIFHHNHKGLQNEVITIRNSTRKIIEGFLTLDGYYHYRLQNDSLNPLFFLDKMNGSLKLYAGIHEGNCLNCGKPLTDPQSLRVGYGPTCAKDLGIY
jgi:hypothetical protein